MMKKLLFFLCAASAVAAGLCSCQQKERNTAELVDPWLRERTPVNFRLDKQVGSAVISTDWRHDDQGSIVVQLVTGGLNLKAVKIVALDFKFPESEYCPTASVKVGDSVDLSSGAAKFTVTAHNGETRTFTVTFTEFVDPIVGTYAHVKIGGILDGSAPQSSMVVHGGWPDAEVVSTAMDKSWHWGDGYTTADEEDNIVSFLLTEVDSESGATFGTIVNYPGDDGKWANYVYNNTYDVNAYYRQIPVGASRWSKDPDGTLYIYDKADAKYAKPLYVLDQLPAGTYSLAGKEVTVSGLAWHRAFTHAESEWVYDWNWPDTRWMVDNIRNTFWTMAKTGSQAAPDHAQAFENYSK